MFRDRKHHELLGHCLQIIVELLLSPSPIFSFCFRFSSYSFHSFHSFHSFPRVDPLLLSGSLALTTQAVQLLPLRGFDGHLLARWADRMDRGWRWQCVPIFLMQSSLLNERLNSHSAWTEMGKYNLYVYIYIEIELDWKELLCTLPAGICKAAFELWGFYLDRDHCNYWRASTENVCEVRMNSKDHTELRVQGSEHK